MYNFRYHIASLVAVFLALAIGLLLGTVVVERGVLDRQRTTLVQSLQTDYTGLKKENDELRRDRERLRAFAADAEPLLVKDVLKGKEVLVITNAGRNDASPVTQEALRAAGARTVVATVKAKGFGRDDPEVAQAISEVASRTSGLAGAADPVVAMLANEWTQEASAQPLTEALRRSGQLDLEGAQQPGRRPDAVVLLATFDGQSDPTLISLTNALVKAGVTGVAVETQGQTTGLTDAALGAGLSSVDDVDRPEGALAMLYVLAGRAEGHFGVKPSATAAYPKLR